MPKSAKLKLQAQILQHLPPFDKVDYTVSFNVLGHTSAIRLAYLVYITAPPFDAYVRCKLGRVPPVNASTIDSFLYLASELCSFRGLGQWNWYIVQTAQGSRHICLSAAEQQNKDPGPPLDSPISAVAILPPAA